MASKEQSIVFTKEQFKNLLKLVYLGNWMANACRSGNDQDPIIRKYEKMQDYIFTLTPKFGLKKYVDHEEADGGVHFPTAYFEEETDVHELHDNYDESIFWEELPIRMGDRDFLEKYSKEEIESMSREEIFMKRCECSALYEEEIHKHGIERLRIVEKE